MKMLNINFFKREVNVLCVIRGVMHEDQPNNMNVQKGENGKIMNKMSRPNNRQHEMD